MSLNDRLKGEIAAGGPISVAEFMTRCLHDPTGGYYATRPAIGEGGDFITAPQVSQMFGELIGVWIIETWRRMGAPARVVLAEAGPGDATLMADVLRVMAAAPALRAACDVWLLEASQPLRELQQQKLAAFAPSWADAAGSIPDDAPLFLVANEFLDCLPVRQYQRTAQGWAERVVGLDGSGELAFGLRPCPPLDADAPPGAVVERSPAQEAFVAEIGHRLARAGGAALFIDYGRAESGVGDTLQALARHRRVGPLACPGHADLTAHVDFPRVLAAARAAGVEAALLTQGEFLRRMGIETRAEALRRRTPERAELVDRQLERLIHPAQMGEAFKVAALWTGAPPPGFEAP